jgi:FMN-dependent NADH-azoreductase
VPTILLGARPLPTDAWGLAVGANFTPNAARTSEQIEALDLVATLGDEILEADTVLVGAPLYNFGVPRGIAEQSLATAHAEATAHGTRLAERLHAAA